MNKVESRKRIIAVIGMPGTGKSTVVNSLVSKFNLPSIHFGNITIEEIRKRGLEENQANEKLVRQDLRAKLGMGAYAYLSIDRIREILEKHGVVLIDGLYSWAEYIMLRKAELAEISLITIISRRKSRYHRLSIRDYRPLSEKEAEKRDFAEIEKLEKGGPIALCDYYITNDGSVEELEESIKNMANELGLQPL